MKSLRYVIHCARMPRTEEVLVQDFMEFMRILGDYVARYGPIDLIYRVS